MNQAFIITGIRRIILVSQQEYPEKKTVFNPNLRSNELIFQFFGQVEIFFNGKQLDVSENTVWFLPRINASGYTVDRIRSGDCIDIFFDTNVPISAEALKLCGNSLKLRNLFQKIFSVWVAKGTGYYFESLSLLYSIFAELQKESYLPEGQYQKIKPAIEEINENFLSSGITAERLSRLCGISYSYVRRLFQKRFGVTPKTYQIQLKMNYACDLLSSEMYSVAETAELCKYDSPAYFSRQFKEYLRISPAEYIRKCKSSK